MTQGPGSNDRSAAERLLNVLTSVPFLLVGGNLIRCSSMHVTCLYWHISFVFW